MSSSSSSSMPTRSRSVRKPVAGTGSQSAPVAAAAAADDDAAAGSQDKITTTAAAAPQDRRANTSPSRLPKLPGSSSGLARKSSVSQQGSAAINGSARLPPRRAATSRPPLSSDNVRPSSHRSGARTPTEVSSSSTSSQRLPGKRQSRTVSTSTLPLNPAGTFPQLADKEKASASVIPSSASTILRPPSSHVSSTAPSQQRQSQPKLTRQIPLLDPPEAIRQQPHQTLQSRPAFSTLQQHFSPLKTLGPKPATASFLVPPSPGKLPSNIQISAETARLQAELLQLHIIHRTAPRVSADYRASAKRALRETFEDVAGRQRELVAAETREEERLNCLALKAWAAGGSGWGLEEKVQRLDEMLNGIWRLGDAGGRYTRLVRRFEAWHATAQEILGSRAEHTSGDVDLDTAFITPLEDSWREECEHLARKLDSWPAQLRELDTLSADAELGVDGGGDDGAGRAAGSLALAVNGARRVVQGMLAELSIMAHLEREIVRRDEEWIRTAVDAASDEDEDGCARAPGAIWRIY